MGLLISLPLARISVDITHVQSHLFLITLAYCRMSPCVFCLTCACCVVCPWQQRCLTTCSSRPSSSHAPLFGMARSAFAASARKGQKD
eukprot:719981-Amphidinium_carterae.1